jgi:hypothetical protein
MICDLTKQEAAAVLDLLRVMPNHVPLDERQQALVRRIQRKLRAVVGSNEPDQADRDAWPRVRPSEWTEEQRAHVHRMVHGGEA